MKRLKIWSMMLFAVMMPVLTSCSSDSDDGAKDSELVKQAVGTWMCTKSTDSAVGQSYDGLLVGKQITIKADGTYTSTASSFGYRGTYSIKGNQITAKSSSGDTFVVTVSISGDRMTWNGTSSTGVTFYYVFTREIDEDTVSVRPPSK